MDSFSLDHNLQLVFGIIGRSSPNGSRLLGATRHHRYSTFWAVRWRSSHLCGFSIGIRPFECKEISGCLSARRRCIIDCSRHGPRFLQRRVYARDDHHRYFKCWKQDQGFNAAKDYRDIFGRCSWSNGGSDATQCHCGRRGSGIPWFYGERIGPLCGNPLSCHKF